MLDDAFRLTIDKIFVPDYINNKTTNYISSFKVDGHDDKENLWEKIGNIYFRYERRIVQFIAPQAQKSAKKMIPTRGRESLFIVFATERGRYFTITL